LASSPKEEGGDLARRLVLDLGVPQHGLPPLGQRPERLHGHGPLGLVHRPYVGAEVQGVVVGGHRAHLRSARGLRREHREVVDQLLTLRRRRPVRGDPADGGEQIGAYGVLRAGAAAYRLEHAGEDLGGEVVGGVAVTAARARVPAYGVGVTPVQLLVRRVVVRAHPPDQAGVGRRQLDGRRQHTVRAGRQQAALALRRDAALHRVVEVLRVLRTGQGAAQVPNAARPALVRHLRGGQPAAGLRVTVTG